MLLADDPARAFMPYPAIAVPSRHAGLLAGLSFGVKDLFDVVGYPTGCGNPVKLAQSPVASRNAPAVQALLDAGATFLGKTHTEELAWSLYGTNAHFGTPLNPAAPDRVPGGSSSGSASAVAAGLCDFALGSDTGGSVRAPASFCGIYGLRPTHGAIALEACMPLAPSFDTCGFFARTISVMRDVAEVLLPKGKMPALHTLMIAQDLFARLSPAAQSALADRVRAVEAVAGAAKPVTVYTEAIDPVYAAFRNLQAHEIYAYHGPWVEKFKPPLGAAIAGRFAFAKSVTDGDVAAGRAVRAAFAQQIHVLMGEAGILIAPVVHGPAPRLDDTAEALDAYRHEAMVFLQVAGMAGLPQLVIPAGKVEGAPLGLSLIGARGMDKALIALAEKMSIV
jgi:amidase